MKSGWGTISLVLVFALLAGYTYFFDFKKQQDEDRQKAESSQLISPGETSDVESLKISHSISFEGKGTVELKRHEGQWFIVEPVDDLADQSQVKRILDDMFSAKSEKVISEKQTNWKVFGLEPPLATIEINRSGEKLKFLVSSRANYQGKPYLRVGEEDRVLLVEPKWKSIAEKKLENLRDKRIFRKASESIVAARVEKNDEALHSFVLRDSVWGWADSSKMIDPALVNRWVRDLHRATVQNFMSEVQDPGELKKYELDRPEYKITLDLKDGEKWVAYASKLVNRDHFVYVKGRTGIFKVVSAPFKGALTKSEKDFWDKAQPFLFEKNDVTQIRIVTNEKKVDLQRPNSGWSESIQEIIKTLATWKASEFTDEVVEVKRKGRTEITMQTSKGPFSVAWSPHGDAFVAKTSHFDEAFRMAKSTVEKLKLDKVLAENTSN